MALALLEAGGPLTLEAIAERLARLALPPRLAAAGLPTALRKAWRGQPPVVRDPVDGRVYLDLLCHHDLRYLAYHANPVDATTTPVEPADFCQPPETVPLSQEEVDAAFRDRTLSTYSSIRRAAAILEASGGGPLSLMEISRRLVALSGRGAAIDERAVGLWSSGLVAVRPDGLLHLSVSSPDVSGLRRDIRRMASARLRHRAEADRARAWRAVREAKRTEERRRELDEARRARRALVHVVAVDGVPRAAAVIEVGIREQRLFIGDSLADLSDHLGAFDVLAGVDLRPSLRSVGLDPDRWWLAELRPTQRTFRPGDRRAVAVSLPAIVHATVGRRVPGDPGVWPPLVRARSTIRLVARLEEEAQALFALTSTARSTQACAFAGARAIGCCRSLGLQSGDPDVESLVSASIRHWVPVEVVVGPSAGLSDTWSAAITVTIVERDRDMLFVREGEDVRVLDVADIHAVRLSEASAGVTVGPARDHHYDSRSCTLKVTLDEIEPPIWRRLEVPASVTLARLHDMFQVALGWTNSHLHVFEIGDQRIAILYDVEPLIEGQITRSARLVRLGDVIDQGVRRFGYDTTSVTRGATPWRSRRCGQSVTATAGCAAWLAPGRARPKTAAGRMAMCGCSTCCLFEARGIRRGAALGRQRVRTGAVRPSGVNAALSVVPWHG